MSFPRYPKYKDSGVEWLGLVPEHWDVWKLSHAFSLIGSGTTPSTDIREYYDDGDIPWVNTADLRDGELDNCEKRITSVALSHHTSLRLYPAGSLLIAMYGATIGKLAVLRSPATVNQACCVLAGESAAITDFMFYWFLGFRQRLLSLATGGGQPNVSQDILRTLRVACPSHDEQTEIAKFLDRETAKIDVLVAEQERLIDLLKEKRQAVISHAVTKGLNPDAPMKPSGVEWLGDVPAHWEVRKLDNLARLESGHTPSRQHPEYWIGEDCVIPWFTLADVGYLRDPRNWLIETTSQKISHIGMENSAARLLPPGTVLLSRTASVGFSGVTTIELAVSQDFAAWICGRRLHPHYLFLCLRAMQQDFGRLMMGSTHQTIYMPDIEAFRVPVPPTEEQVAIHAAMFAETAKLDALTQEAERAIDLLQERRTALISAAVTGQIDVRQLTEEAVA